MNLARPWAAAKLRHYVLNRDAEDAEDERIDSRTAANEARQGQFVRHAHRGPCFEGAEIAEAQAVPFFAVRDDLDR